MPKVIAKGKDWIKLTVDPKVYSLATIYSAGYVFLDKIYIYLDKDNKGKIDIWLFPKNKKESLDKLGMDFYNELLNYAHYFNRVKANAEIIRMIMQRVLFSVNPASLSKAEDKRVEDLINELEKEKPSRKNKAYITKKKK